MPQRYTGRLILIGVVLLLALIAIFSPVLSSPRKLFDRNLSWSEKINLRPGIDMIGGTSLLYDIKVPEGAAQTADFANEVMNALKERVDPEGVRNLIWRPQGTQLEIQMPLSAGSGNAEEARKQLVAAGEKLEHGNLRTGSVLAAVEQKDPAERQKSLAAMAGNSKQRQELFAQLAKTYDQIQAARKNRDAALEAKKRNEYEDLQKQIQQTNLTIRELDSVLSAKEQREQKLQDLRKRFSDDPARLEAIDAYVKAYDGFQGVRSLVNDVADLKRLLKGSGVLEYHIVADDAPVEEIRQMTERLQREGPRPRAGDRLRWYELDRPDEYPGGYPQAEYNGVKYALAWITPDKSMVNRAGQPHWALERAFKTQGEYGEQVVGFTFDTEGAKVFGDLTGNHQGRPMAIMLDDKIISAPTIQQRIAGSGTITGGGDGFTRSELDYLVRTLSAGSLPAQLADEPIREQTIGPQLGRDNLMRGLYACLFGLVVVAVFLIGYYYIAGIIATIAVMLNMVIILGVMAAVPGATFTLPGVAGIVLTIGMAVDANVLIFERLREEQTRGLSLRMALRNAYDKAFSAILDSNVTTAITAAILVWFGSEEVKGFGLTLLIGLLSSLFTALFVTKTLFGVLIDRFGLQKLGSLPLTFPKWDRALRPNIDWMSKAWMFYAFSAAFIAVGLTAFGMKLARGEMFDIEFTGGTSVQFELVRKLDREEVQNRMNAITRVRPADLPNPNVVAIGKEDLTFEVTTPSMDSKRVREAIVAAMGSDLNVSRESKFEQSGKDFEEALQAGTIVPIQNAAQEIAGIVPSKLPDHVGGAAIILRDLDPPLKAEQVKDRIQQQRLAAASNQESRQYLNFDVEQLPSTDDKTSSVVVLVSNPDFTYDPDNPLMLQQWKDEVTAPTWRLINDAISKPAELQKVSNFNAQVAGKAQRDALIAMVLSVLVIMAYIWVRFGNLKYGAATVVALLHDTLFVLAAIGLSHYLAPYSWASDGLLIQGFRINLTLVAAVLTVMGYSMNDTVVVFDRIRENRGKFGHLSRRIVNDSINQTLSRTLLTGGTTIITIFVMYIFGGPGIHGFTFALLVGILVGTYSSIAIAAPLLLLGTERRQESTTGQPAGKLQRVGA